MSGYEDILENNSNNTKSNYNNNYNRNNWQEKQNKLRQQAYEIMDKMAIEIKDNSEKFKQYLNIQSKFEKNSVGNCLLILSKNPNVTQYKDKKSWKEKGIELISNPQEIVILEPKRSETNNRIYYNPKIVYDISQTNAPKQEQSVEYDTRELLKAFLNNCNTPRKAVDKLPNTDIAGAEYNKSEDVLYVCRGMDRETLFQTLSQALADIEMKDIENDDFKSFKSYCISYMLCQKYGIDVSNYDVIEPTIEITSKQTGKEVREELEKMRIDYEKINSRVAEYFEKGNREKEKKPKIQER